MDKKVTSDQLIIPVYLNEKTVLDMLAIIGYLLESGRIIKHWKTIWWYIYESDIRQAIKNPTGR